MNIILIGPPATGKGTQASALSKHFNIPHISTGDIFRKHFVLKTKLGKLANSYIEKGSLVPDEVTNAMISERLSQNDVKNGFVLDGFPRNLFQAKFLTKEFEDKKIILTKVIYFNSSEECLKQRILGRIICPKCGEIYHLVTKVPQKANLCDKDKTPLIRRKDDNLETFNKRLNIYKQETLPLVEYYQKENKIIEIIVNDPKISIKDVTQLLLKKISHL
ncbi:MAG: adenylate kinase [Candidatus Phytoplasma pruni]|uniref:adenylate kinase n=1 Tax=Poinsettia branch-inducing phytoplasma TaxID=138647 RepID=UPI0003604FB0|nr:adenylate kinase [Poinsettia branch-inducing phytoplasma]MDW3617828.1 adenylate kinase [Candidatus Phytoplasma pruni]WEK82358.1 MAG: adenylate kinase [Candidatus Phytoplasma pruni]